MPYLTTVGRCWRGIDVTGDIVGTIIYLSSICGICGIGGIVGIGEIGGVGGIGGGSRVGLSMPTLDIGGSSGGKGGQEGEEEEDGNGNGRHGARHCH